MSVDVVVPLLLVLMLAQVLLATARGKFSIVHDTSRPYFWLLVVSWLILAGDAALGENRPTFERAWKGALAVLLAASFGLDLWRRRRLARTAPPPPADD
ncbi:hypothetical protein [Micromonospora sagamiensis]|uniref:Uncharacterized protein n=1 Tax=Micromonospora sagamiensis TaxID=47875 RepID=A0A562WAW2_9ACTN|nr:hypothetical protein [Micromonospora sagamiensis]TWJ27255.1 hypothetical protein JD81_00742 [Micromonospora sagamiensis]BCL13851.1 hypothetical protein GCM10017556_15900 [Micromonospora sagamiensis]